MKHKKISLIPVCMLALTILVTACGAPSDPVPFHAGSGSPTAAPGSTNPGQDIDRIGVTPYASLPTLSDNYLIGMSFGGGGDEKYWCESGDLILCKDRTVIVSYYHEELGRYTISEDQYNTIVNGIDMNKLYNLEPEEDQLVLDGYSTYLYLYGADDEICAFIGGYMPRNSYFNETYRLLEDNIDITNALRLREARIIELIDLENSDICYSIVHENSEAWDSDPLDYPSMEEFPDPRYGTTEGYYLDSPNYLIFRSDGIQLYPYVLEIFSEEFDYFGSIDFSECRYPMNESGDVIETLVPESIFYAYIPDGSDILYVSMAHDGQAKDNPDTGYIYALSLSDSLTSGKPKLLWKSASQVSNAYNFIVNDNVIISAFGSEDSSALYLIDIKNGTVMDSYELDSAPYYLYQDGSSIYVRTESMRHTFSISVS